MPLNLGQPEAMLATQEDTSRTQGMRQMEGGVFLMGSDRFYPEERPARNVRVSAFWIDTCPVTNREFSQFVYATGHRTLAEIPPDPADYPGLNPDLARAGSLVFERTAGAVPLNDPARWWFFRAGADWRHPTGAGSSLDALMDHPVVHVAQADALAYANWAGKSLPTEAEWEYAARGGLSGVDYGWGDELNPDGRVLANYWRGHFPYSNLREDGGYRTVPVRSFPSNGHGLYDMPAAVHERRGLRMEYEGEASRRYRRLGGSLHGSDEMDWNEWRANEFMGAFLAPPVAFHQSLVRLANEHGLPLLNRPSLGKIGLPIIDIRRADVDALEETVDRLGEAFGITPDFARVRMRKYGLITKQKE